MVKTELWLVVNVVLGCTTLAVVVEAVCRVVLMVHYAINLLCHLPVGKLHGTLTLIVLLRSAKGCERELMSIVNALRDVEEVGIATKVGTLCITIAPCLRSEQCHSPTCL